MVGPAGECRSKGSPVDPGDDASPKSFQISKVVALVAILLLVIVWRGRSSADDASSSISAGVPDQKTLLASNFALIDINLRGVDPGSSRDERLSQDTYQIAAASAQSQAADRSRGSSGHPSVATSSASSINWTTLEPLLRCHNVPLFSRFEITQEMRDDFNREGHLLLPGILTEEATAKMIASVENVKRIDDQKRATQRGRKAISDFLKRWPKAQQDCKKVDFNFQFLSELEQVRNTNPDLRWLLPRHVAAEHDEYLESVIGHPQLLAIVRQILGDDIRFDHLSALPRVPGSKEVAWHTHEYADGQFPFHVPFNPTGSLPKVGQLQDSIFSKNDRSLGYIRVFFYVSGLEEGNGNLKVVPGSHHYRLPNTTACNDTHFQETWLKGKKNPVTGKKLEVKELSAPRGTVILLWTHGAHGVNPRHKKSPTRWSLVAAYRNPGAPSSSRLITPEFERKPTPGLIREDLGPSGLKDHVY